MLTALWEGLGPRLADRWSSTAVAALVFWALGLAGVCWHVGFGAATASVSSWVSARTSVVQGAAVAGVFIAIVGSALLVARLTLPVTRLLEGYGWPFWLRWPLVAWHARRMRDAEEEFQRTRATLADMSLTGASRRRAHERSARLEILLRVFPTEPDLDSPARLMPTRLGNILRAAETRPVDYYGLDALICWPRLWLCLPDTTRAELTAARGALDSAVAACCWSLLFLAWAPWQIVALPVGLVASVLAYRVWVLPRARAFAELVDAAFDLHRGALYDALRWPKPANPAEEAALGRALTAYLWRGSDSEQPMFTSASP